MYENFNNFSSQDIIKMANSEAGQKLIAYLQQQNSKQVSYAMEKAAAGDYSQAKQTVNELLTDPKTVQLLEQLRRSNNG